MTNMHIIRTALWASLAAVSMIAPAHAQKSADTIRMSIINMFSVVDPYHFLVDENGQFFRTIYQPLIDFDEHKQRFVPTLARSWVRIDNTTLEFELRDDVTFHNGNKFTADDVIATVDYITDPKTQLRSKQNYDWARAEKIGPYKIRIHAKEPFAFDLSALAYRFKILDGKVLAGLETKADYGRVAPVATGPYKINYVDRNKGIQVERFDGLVAGKGYYRAPVKFVQGLPIADRQTQQAQLLTGGIDLLRNITGDDAAELAKVPNLKVTPTVSANLLYVTLDAAGRSENKAFKDERLRKAFIMAIDRESIVKNIVPGGEIAELPKAICFKDTTGCAPTSNVYAYNPAEAKRLVVEAGHPDGVDLVLYASQPVAYIAQAIAGEVRKVGIRASVQPLQAVTYTKKRDDGELTAFINYYPTIIEPDVKNLLNWFFNDSRDYADDKIIADAFKSALTEFDLEKRAKIYAPALDVINTKAYVLPLTELPMVWAHTQDVKILKNPLSAGEIRVGDWAWTDYKE